MGYAHGRIFSLKEIASQFACKEKIRFARIALRRKEIVSLKRPAAGGESCKQDSYAHSENL